MLKIFNVGDIIKDKKNGHIYECVSCVPTVEGGNISSVEHFFVKISEPYSDNWYSYIASYTIYESIDENIYEIIDEVNIITLKKMVIKIEEMIKEFPREVRKAILDRIYKMLNIKVGEKDKFDGFVNIINMYYELIEFFKDEKHV